MCSWLTLFLWLLLFPSSACYRSLLLLQRRESLGIWMHGNKGSPKRKTSIHTSCMACCNSSVLELYGDRPLQGRMPECRQRGYLQRQIIGPQCTAASDGCFGCNRYPKGAQTIFSVLPCYCRWISKSAQTKNAGQSDRDQPGKARKPRSNQLEF